MGDRFTLHLKCAGCAFEQEAYYAESSGFESFTCEKCKAINWIDMGFLTKIISKEEEKRLYKENGFG